MPPSGIRRFFDILATMDDVISLGVGEPDFDTPREIVEAGVESLREGRTHYTSNFGTIELRRALSAHLERLLWRPLRPGDRDPGHRRRLGGRRPRAAGDLRPGRRGDPPRAVVRRLRPGDRVRGRRRPPRRDARRGRLRARPGRRRGRDHAADQGAVPGLPGQPDRRRPATTTSRTSWPGSPSATTCSSTATRSTTASPTARTATGRSARCPGMRERTILMGGFSKAYAMTGWRVGYVCAPAGILEGMVKVHQYGIMSAPTVAQDAALAALQAGEPAVAARWSPSTTAAGGCSSTASTRIGLRDVRAPRRLLRLPGITLDRPDLRRVHRAPAARGEGRGRARVTRSGRRAPGTCGCATRPSYERLEEALVRIGRFVERVARA